jgi:hypothetical protein
MLQSAAQDGGPVAYGQKTAEVPGPGSRLSARRHLTGWEKELPNLRDPAAHRVPIYVPPTVATSQEQADEIKRILAQADAVPSGGSQRSFTELYLEAQAVADFKPIMVLSTRQGWTYRLIHGQVRADHDKYLAITSAIVDAL